MSAPARMPCTVYRLRMAARRATRLYDRQLAPSGLGIAQFGLLQTLAHNDGATVTDLAAALDLERTALTRNLRPLIRLGLVAQGAGQDRRSRAVTITEAGRAKLAEAVPLWRNAQSIVRESLGGERTDELLAHLKTAIERIPDA